MKIIVQKYGGSSLRTPELIKNVARRIAKTKDEGYEVVVVASAMGDTTDKLIELARKISKNPPPRELDMLMSTGEIVSSSLLAMALIDLGYDAVSLAGFQAGIRTDNTFTKARVEDIDDMRIREELAKGKIVVVAGFQGITEGMDITTLGRGGSDTTAVALAVKLGALRCEIYTDVEGVYTADPRIIPEAKKLPEIGYEEMLELASLGAKVMHPRAVELGEVYNIPILVALSFEEKEGTWIRRSDMELKSKVRGIAHDLDVAKITIRGVPDRPGIAAAIFEPLAEASINVDTIVQNASLEGLTDITFTVSRRDLEKALSTIKPVLPKIGAKDIASDIKVGKVSIVGAGMQSTPGYASKMFRALYEQGINIQIITTSEIRITCIIDEERVIDAVKALHKAFELEKA